MKVGPQLEALAYFLRLSLNRAVAGKNKTTADNAPPSNNVVSDIPDSTCAGTVMMNPAGISHVSKILKNPG